MIVVSGIRLPLGGTEEQAFERALSVTRLPLSRVRNRAVRRVSYDARHRQVSMVCSVEMHLDNEGIERQLSAAIPSVAFFEENRFAPEFGFLPLKTRPVVAGFGPAGMFAAYALALYGYWPIVLERGGDMDSRVRAVQGFFGGGAFDSRTNVQFGEGGAGTFSDGKLTTRINDPLCRFVLETFVRFGAPADILKKAKPHIGTDRLRAVVRAMREEIVRLGGEVRFMTRATGFDIRNGALKGVYTEEGYLAADVLLLACGHSARDTFAALRDVGVQLQAKPFSVGARIEHLQADVDRSLWGANAGDPRLPHGEYNLSAHVGDRGVYTFCMCPGGMVVAAASEEGGMVTNGMSSYARAEQNANSALVVSVGPADFGDDPFRAMEYQKKIEQAAFALAGGDFKAPASDVAHFLDRKAGFSSGCVTPSYPRGVVAANLDAVLGSEITDAMRAGLGIFAKKMRCFGQSTAVLTGPETRTSSPVRVARDDSRQALGVAGLYPCGEGAGYAGGIMSAAVDGLKSAEAVMRQYKPLETE